MSPFSNPENSKPSLLLQWIDSTLEKQSSDAIVQQHSKLWVFLENFHIFNLESLEPLNNSSYSGLQKSENTVFQCPFRVFWLNSHLWL